MVCEHRVTIILKDNFPYCVCMLIKMDFGNSKNNLGWKYHVTCSLSFTGIFSRDELTVFKGQKCAERR